MTEAPPSPESAAPNPQPTLETIVRLVEQAIVEQQETRERIDGRDEIMKLRFDSLQKQLDGVDARERANFLVLTGDLSEVRRHVATIEEHVGFLTTKMTEHDKRFDRIDTRLEDHDKRFDRIDTRLEDHDKRFEEVDARFDAVDDRLDRIDTRLDGLVALTTEIRDAVLPSGS